MRLVWHYTSISLILFPISSVPSSFLIARFISSSRANSTILQNFHPKNEIFEIEWIYYFYHIITLLQLCLYGTARTWRHQLASCNLSNPGRNISMLPSMIQCRAVQCRAVVMSTRREEKIICWKIILKGTNCSKFKLREGPLLGQNFSSSPYLLGCYTGTQIINRPRKMTHNNS